MIAATVLVSGCAGSGRNDAAAPGGEHKSDMAAQYTCPMHPEIVRDKPGDCPKCGMALGQKR